jgi:hypothetical protein
MAKLIDLSGIKLKYCSVIDQNNTIKYSGSVWNCGCICGNNFSTASRNIRNNKNINCGCIKRKGKLTHNLGNQKYENFIVMDDYIQKNGSIYWICKCICGNIFQASSQHIRKNIIYSCGCKRRRKNGISSYDFNAKRKYEQYKIGAKNRGLCFDLTLNEFISITQRNCYYCNSKPSQIHVVKYKSELNNNEPFIYNGIDRIDNDKGYKINNCVPCCGFCNKMKHKNSFNDFTIKIKKIYENLNLSEREF